MGWLCGDKPSNVKEFLDSRMGEGYTVLKSALKLTEYYAAVRAPDGSVFAMMYKLSFTKTCNSMEMCRKDMDETCGPYMYKCPESILKLLTPTNSEYANNWRAANAKVIANKKLTSTLKVGAKVTYGNMNYELLEKQRFGAWRVKDEFGTTYRMKRSQLEAAVRYPLGEIS